MNDGRMRVSASDCDSSAWEIRYKGEVLKGVERLDIYFHPDGMLSGLVRDGSSNSDGPKQQAL